MRYVLRALVLSSFLSLLFSSAVFGQDRYVLPDRYADRAEGMVRDFVDEISQNASEFRLVREVEDFPEIEGKTLPLKIELTEEQMERLAQDNAPPLILALTDRATGKPLDSCQAPCTLTSPMVPPGVITTYRYGSKPRLYGAEMLLYDPKNFQLFLGFNEVEHMKEREKCMEEDEADRKTISDRDAAPCIRIPPEMPAMAKRSGHCNMLFSVSQRGDAVDVVARECTEQVFCDPSIESVQRWFYHPAMKLGETVERPSVETRISFRLTDPQGNVIPEPEDDLQPCVGLS